MRATARALSVERTAKTLLPRLGRSRIWHCYCAAAEPAAEAAGGRAAGPATRCANGEQCSCLCLFVAAPCSEAELSSR